MDKDERSERFQGFARLLWEEMLSQTQGYYIDVTAGHIPLRHPEDDDHKPYIDLIARRAYDLVAYTLEWCRALELDLEWIDAYDPANKIPDLTEWLIPKPPTP